MGYTINAKHVTKSFGKVTAIKDLSFSSSKGLTIIIGPNGAGKSTFLRCLMGLYRLDGGTVTVLGRDPYRYDEIKMNLAMLSENYALYDYLSSIDNLRFFGRMYGMSYSEIENKARKLLKELNAEMFLNAKVGTLSRGTKQKIALCRALINDPEVLLLDEPTAFLDYNSSEVIKSMLLDFEKEGKTIVFVTQRMEEVIGLDSNIAVMNKGEIVKRSKAGELSKSIFKKSRITINFSKPVDLNLIKHIKGLSDYGSGSRISVEFHTDSYKDVNRILSELISSGVYIASLNYKKALIESLSGK